MAGKSMYSHVPGGPLIDLQAEAMRGFEQNQGLFVQTGAIGRLNTGGIHYEDIMSQTRTLGGESRRGFAAERNMQVTEFASAPYSPMPLPNPREHQATGAVLTHSFQTLVAYVAPKGRILGLMHMVELGVDRNGPHPEVDEIIDQAIVFEDNSVKYRALGAGALLYHEYGPNDRDEIEDLRQGFVAQEFGELRDTHLPIGIRKIDRARRSLSVVGGQIGLFVRTAKESARKGR